MNSFNPDLFPAEVHYMRELFAYPCLEELSFLESIEDAEIQLAGMLECCDPEDFPDGLKNPGVLLSVFNFVVTEELDRKSVV